MTSYEGLFLETGRHDEGRQLLQTAADSLSKGMLANTADAGGTEYNTVDASMWFGIRVDGDGFVTQGADGWALTWMDARVDGRPVTRRAGKPVEVNAL